MSQSQDDLIAKVAKAIGDISVSDSSIMELYRTSLWNKLSDELLKRIAKTAIDVIKTELPNQGEPLSDPAKWRLIASAPKDREIMLASIRHNDDGSAEYDEIDVGQWQWISEGWESNPPGYYGWATNSGRIDEPTHWAPMMEVERDLTTDIEGGL